MVDKLLTREFLVVGIREIVTGKFEKIENRKLSALFKPNGGLWASDFKENDYYKSDWIRFCTLNASDWLDSDCVRFTLKGDARILVINNKTILLELLSKYKRIITIPDSLKILEDFYKRCYIDFELLSKDYDGIYVDFNWFKRFRSEECSDKDYRDLFNLWDVNSLLLFNLNCIDRSEYYELNVEEFKDNRQ